MILFQIKKIKIFPDKTFPLVGAMDVTAKDLLLVRVKDETTYWIRVLQRLTGDLINEIQSTCNHDEVQTNRHPQSPNYMLEGCKECKEIRSCNINTEETFLVHKGSGIARMIDGPSKSLIVVDTDDKLFMLDWNKGPQHKPNIRYKTAVPSVRLNKMSVRFCYLECHDIFITIVKDNEEDQDYELIAVNLENGNVMWRLFGPVDGCAIKPGSLTCDSEGNVLVSDQTSNRILKINSLTGDILSILPLEQEEIIESISWSNTEPNLTVLQGQEIRTYFVPT